MLTNLEQYLHYLRHPVVIADSLGNATMVNATFQEFFLKRSFESFKPNIFDFFKDTPSLVETIKKVVVEKGSFTLREIPLITVAGEQKNLDVEVFPLLKSSGDIDGFSILMIDRRDMAHLQEQQKRQDRLGYLSTIASGLAHEIRNPLSGIRGAAQLLGNSLEEGDEKKEYAQIIQKEVDRVDMLLKDLLDFTKPRKLNKKSVNVNQILHDLVLLQKTVESDRITLIEEYDPSLPNIHADPEALSQIFLNLIKNARQAIKKSGTITVRSGMAMNFKLKKGDRKQKLILVSVSDTGSGIDDDVLSHIFVPFFTTKVQGSGLGLAMTYQLLEKHGGDIAIETQKGQGTTFLVYLPS